MATLLYSLEEGGSLSAVTSSSVILHPLAVPQQRTYHDAKSGLGMLAFPRDTHFLHREVERKWPRVPGGGRCEGQQQNMGESCVRVCGKQGWAHPSPCIHRKGDEARILHATDILLLRAFPSSCPRG